MTNFWFSVPGLDDNVLLSWKTWDFNVLSHSNFNGNKTKSLLDPENYQIHMIDNAIIQDIFIVLIFL